MRRKDLATDYTDVDRLDFYDTTRKHNVSFRVYSGHWDLINAAATRLHLSAASYVRKIVIEAAAAELRVQPPEFESLETRRDLIAEAAKTEGLTPAEFSRREAARAAQQILASRNRMPPPARLQPRKPPKR